MTEVWRDVAGFESIYQVSDQGRVRRCGGRTLRPRRARKGYLRVALHCGLRTEVMIHRLVAEAFLSTRPEGTECNHRDGDKTNNALPNLEWVTPSQNVKHAYAIGLMSKVGSLNGRARLREPDVLAIRDDARATPARVLARRFGISTVAIHHVLSGRTWRHLLPRDEPQIRQLLLGERA